MTTTKHGWTIVNEDEGALMFTYDFAKDATSNTMTARLADGSLCVISPPCRVDDGVLRDLEPFGPVRMIVATNAYHHLGLPSWSKAFPEASLHAHPKALKRLTKLHPTLKLQEVKDGTGGEAGVRSVPGTRTGDVWLRAGRTWYVGDQFMNFKQTPKGLVGMLFGMTGNAPGFKANGVGRALFMSDKKAYKRWALATLAEQGPERVVPGHGALEQGNAVAERMKHELETRF